MLAFKIALYILTLGSAFFFGFWELKLRRQLTDGSLEQHENVSDFDSLYDVRKEIRRERLLNRLPREVRFKLRVVVSLKLLFFAILVIEVILLQR